MTGDERQAAPVYKRSLGVGDVCLMIVVAVVSMRWIPRGARAGPVSLPLWAAAGLLFFLPLALAVRDLSKRFPDQGGLYVWARRSFGPAHGFFCGWCLWLNPMFYIPGYLLFAFTNLAVLTPDSWHLQQSRTAGVICVLGLLWLLTGLNIIGLNLTKWIQNIGTIGIWVPLFLLLVFAGVHVVTQPSATSFAPGAFIPRAGSLQVLSLWSSMCFAFSGVEIASFVSQEVRRPERSISLAVGIAGVFITLVYVGGSIAILLALDPANLHEATGLGDAIALLTRHPGAGQSIAALLGVAAIATTNSWVAGGARIGFAAGEEDVFPRFLGRLHGRFRTPHTALLAQAAGATVVLLASLLIRVEGNAAGLQEAYDILVNLGILLYFVPYLYLFVIELKQVPGRAVLAAAGLATTSIAIVLTFAPPPGTKSLPNFEVNVFLQAGGTLLAGVVLYRLRARWRRAA